MANTLLTDLVTDLSAPERQGVLRWLNSPAHNQQRELIPLFQYLAGHLHDLGILPEPTVAYSQVYPGLPFNKSKWAKVQHQLLVQIEAYLIYAQQSNNEWRHRRSIMHIYRSRGLTRHLKTRVRRFQAGFPRQSRTASTERYWHDYYLEKEAYYLSASSSRSDKHNLPEQEKKLLLALAAVKLRQACETLAHLRIFRRDYQVPLLDEVLALCTQEELLATPGIRLFYLATLLYRETAADTDAIFLDLKQGIEQHIDEFPTEDQRNLLVLVINHCLRQSNAGRLDFLRQTLDLYQLGLHRKIFYDSGRIGIFTFNNILGIALRLGEIDWAEHFLEQHVRRLPPEKKVEVESLSRARLSFQRKDYDQTLSYLQTADYQDFIHHLTARVMQLKIFFERGDFNLLTSHIRSSKTFLRRRKNLGYHQRNYLNIFSLTEKILKLPPGKHPARQQLEAHILATEPCTEKDWLVAMVKG